MTNASDYFGMGQPDTVGTLLDDYAASKAATGTITPPAFQGSAGIAQGRIETPTSYEPNYANYQPPAVQEPEDPVWAAAVSNMLQSISAQNAQFLDPYNEPYKEQQGIIEQGMANAQQGVQATYPGPTLRDLALQDQDVGRTQMTPFSDAYRSIRNPINEVYGQYVRDPLEDVVSTGLGAARIAVPGLDLGIEGYNALARRAPDVPFVGWDVTPEITNRGVANLVVPQNIEQ